jgi:hypothetical protein
VKEQPTESVRRHDLAIPLSHDGAGKSPARAIAPPQPNLEPSLETSRHPLICPKVSCCRARYVMVRGTARRSFDRDGRKNLGGSAVTSSSPSLSNNDERVRVGTKFDACDAVVYRWAEGNSDCQDGRPRYGNMARCRARGTMPSR